MPADKVVLAYYAAMCVVELAWFREIPEAPWLIGLHLLGGVTILLAARLAPCPGKSRLCRIVWGFRNWYPLLFVAWCYREMSILIPDIRHARFDRALADLDFRVWGANPCVWLERWYTPALTEFLQVIYTLFIPAILFPPLITWWRGKHREFRYMAFLLALGFLASYIGYIILPAKGPRYLLASLQHVPLQGLWLFNTMQAALNRLEKDHFDCFPSGHTEITVLAFWLSRRVSKPLFRAYSLYTCGIVFATVYLRYHYTADIFAGIAVAVILILVSPALYRGLSDKGESIGD